MKKTLLLLAIICCFVSNTRATQYMVMVANYSFTPSSFSMHMGDTVMWMWSNGTHTTTSTSVPPGAATWNSNIDASTTSFMYVPTKVGAYSYQCNFHASLGMTGTFTVTSPTEVPTVAAQTTMNVYPNPTSGPVFIKFSGSDDPVYLSIINAAGRTILTNTYRGAPGAEVNLNTMPNGMYLISVQQNNLANKQELIVSH